MKAKYNIVKLLRDRDGCKYFLATDDDGNEKYIIRQINLEYIDDKEKKELFFQESVLKNLDFPNIIKHKEVLVSRKPIKALNIITEFLDGDDLAQKIEAQKEKHFPESQILDYFIQICLALQFLHNKKIFNYGLSIKNICLTKSGIVKLCDSINCKGFKETWNTYDFLCKGFYDISPEEMKGRPHDAKSDIWLLGELLYQLLTFKMPFNTDTKSLSFHKNYNYYPLPKIYSEGIKDILKKCLIVEPEKRPTIKDILQLPIIKDRINNFLNEVQYDKNLYKIIVNKYKDNKKIKKYEEDKEKQSKENDINKEEKTSEKNEDEDEDEDKKKS